MQGCVRWEKPYIDMLTKSDSSILARLGSDLNYIFNTFNVELKFGKVWQATTNKIHSKGGGGCGLDSSRTILL